MKDITRYSEILHCLHDEEEPHGRIGRGTHCSIFRIVTWHDTRGRICPRASIQDFGVVWDEDHDPRVIGVAERMYVAGLMYPVLYIGERKGVLTVALCREFAEEASEAELDDYKEKVRSIARSIHLDEGGEDSWSAQFVAFENGDRGRNTPVPDATTSELSNLIGDDHFKVDTYLRNIDNLWSLGHKLFRDDSGAQQKLPSPQSQGGTEEQANLIIELIKEICSLQGQREISPNRQIALDNLTAELQAFRDYFAKYLGINPDYVKIDCSEGVGKQPIIPWVRICSEAAAPHPTSGYFVDLLFSWDQKPYLVIIPGAGDATEAEMENRREFARRALRKANPNALDDFQTHVNLQTSRGRFPRLYEAGIVLAEELDLDEITEEVLLGRICVQLKMLAVIYEDIQ